MPRRKNPLCLSKSKVRKAIESFLKPDASFLEEGPVSTPWWNWVRAT